MGIKTDEKLVCGICHSEAKIVQADKIRKVNIFAVKCTSCKQEGPRIGFLLSTNREADDELAKEQAVRVWKVVHR